MLGKWWLGSRGTNPRPWDPWLWNELDPCANLLDLANMIKWAAQGQHVRLEFVPDSVAGIPDERPGEYAA